jgi:anti-anti-sigma factor
MIKTKKINGYAVLVVSGRIINIDSEKFQKKMEGYCRKKMDKFIVDISDVSFMDSYGLGTLVQHHTQIQKKGNEFIVLNTNTDSSTYIRRLFNMTGLNKIFTLVNSYDSLGST